MSLTNDELIKLLKDYHFKESIFYEKNKSLIVPASTNSPCEVKYEIRKGDIYTAFIKRPYELIVYFKQGKIGRYECKKLKSTYEQKYKGH